MSGKVILVLVDGLGYSTAVSQCGYLEGQVQNGAARRWRMTSELPSMSRPIYETVHTGVAPASHGITANEVVRLSSQDHVFGIVRRAGKRTAAAAYSWFSELYNTAPFDPVRHADNHDDDTNIQFGRFYSESNYPDADLFQQASALVHNVEPDYLLLHPMGCDHIGHLHGGESPQYRTQATRIDSLLARFLPVWREQGYQVLVTADHGMNADGYHGGTTDDVRHVPFYHFGSAMNGTTTESASQLAVAPTVLSLMGLTIPRAMPAAPLA